MSETKPNKRFVFLLLEEFSQLPFTCAVETLRHANRYTGRLIYDWILVGETGETARASNTISFNLNADLIETKRDDVIVVCGGINIKENTTAPVINWLRKEARKGVQIGAICTAPYVLAKAGLLDGKRCTIHWENLDSFQEDFPELDLQKTVFAVDGNRFTAAGGVSSIDLMLSIIGTDISQDASNWVSDQLIYNTARTERDGQRLSIPTRIGVRHPKLANVIKMMEGNIEEPISPSMLAQEVGMSTRQLERLFRRYLDRSPKRYYMELRLQKARNLLMQTDMTVINVALACGFTSPSHFSKCYRAQYDTTPYRERGGPISG
ncbi:AraC family transcriptional regulator [Amylibacter marinus]|uniref:AraC family transcriptional regulator n=1 Tax=Amylibacter marinus TaxID=1475483 RepID=A0ABQ5VX98_9RHOB|nr:GlxA family transcriptional regulator [Amylibacter marinus]GLQ36046.1 AraC family transcriptional regulator [Amylibacter marinus]